MRLAVEFVKIPVCFDVSRLTFEVSQFAEAEWLPHPQGHPGNAAIPLVAAHGDPSNNATKGPMRPTPALDRCPYLRQVLASFQTVIGRTRLMRLDANAEATPHVDTNYYWFHRVRVHVPILTAPTVQFVCGGRSLSMAAGEAWIFDTWKPHNVVNPNATQRVHLVADSVGSAAFWELVAHDVSPVASSARTPAIPRYVPFLPDTHPALLLERVNQPVVMSPWEQTSLLTSLFDDLVTSGAPQLPLLAELRQVLTRFQQDWRALWARYGEAMEGWPAYQTLLRALDGQLPRFEQRFLLPNRSDAVEIIRQMVIRPALNPDLSVTPMLRAVPATVPERPAPPTTASTPAPARVPSAHSRIAHPIFIVSPPRSGSSLLFETLAQSPTVYTIGKESHALIEGLPQLHPAHREFSSNRLTAADADTDTAEHLRANFLAQMYDRDGQAPDPRMAGVRFLEKTPKNALRVPFFQAIFPDAVFIYLYRDPREEISSMMDAWRSGRFVTYPRLPGWSGLRWSLVLVPGWLEMIGKPLAEIVARQWATTTQVLLDDLERLPPEQWCVASYDRLVSDPQTEVERLCDFVNIAWDRHLTAPLPLARHTLTPPDPDKWRRNEVVLTEVLPLVADVAARARDFFARAPVAMPIRRVALPPTPGHTPPPSVSPAVSQPPPATAEQAHPFRSRYTASVPELLRRLHSSLLVSTYQSGHVITVRADGGQLNTHFRDFQSPMGMAVGPQYLAIGTQHHVWEYRNQPAVARKLDPPGKHDACFLPRAAHVTGDIRIHELAFAEQALWLVNTRFSCLCTLDEAHSFVPRWRPRFVSHLAAEDRCHLNGMAVSDQRVRFVTALGQTNTPNGWRERKASGGCVIDVESGEIVVAGLSMPHSPRWYHGRLWVLESGKGTLATLDIDSGRIDTVAELPGFTRGLAFAGPYAFIGLSQVRESVFGGIPLTERLQERACGVWVVNIQSGNIVGFVRFADAIQEIFDIQLLAGLRFPDLSDPDGELIGGAYVLPAAALAEVWQGHDGELTREQHCGSCD